MVTKSGTLVKIKTSNLSGEGVIAVSAEREVKKVQFHVNERGTGRSFDFSYAPCGKQAELPFCIREPRLWNISSPNLYEYRLTLTFEGSEEQEEGRFAFRTLSTNGKEVCVNGTPVFIRGYIRGATAHDHQNNCKLSEEEFYRKNIRAAKKFGFNFVRFHSAVPSETFFRVADEEGILVHIELRLPDDIYDNLREMTTTGSMLISDEYLREVINKLYEHPSLCVYCIGNEIKNCASGRVDEIYNVIGQEDGTRLFLDTCAWGQVNRKNVNVDVQHMSYYFPFNSHADMFEDTENLLVLGADEDAPLKSDGENSFVSRELHFTVPLLAHEVCHYTALRDFKALKEKFLHYGVTPPWWVDEELKMIEAKGYAAQYDEMYRASKYFQGECWKTAFEAIRNSRLLGGFHFLQLADTDRYENSNGVLDCFDDESAVSSEWFKKFNGDRVLLASLKNRLFAAGEELVVPLSLSNCGEDSAQKADLSYRLTAGGKTYASGALKNIDVSKKGLYSVCKLHITLPQCNASQMLTLSASLTAGGEEYACNEWKIWIYGKQNRISYSDFVHYEKDGVVITNDCNKAFAALEEGKKVCLVYREDWTRHVRQKDMAAPEYAFEASWNRFKPVIWDRGTNFGGLCNEELLNKYGFAAGKYYDYNFGTLSEDCDKINLDNFPCKVTSLVSGIDKSSRDRFDASKECFHLPELMYDRTLRNYSYLFELAAGKGKLLVCGLNLTGLDSGEPSTQCMAQFILQYLASSDFSPACGTDVATLKEYMKKCAKAPVKERMMTQFWALDDAPVESKQFWKESKQYLIEE